MADEPSRGSGQFILNSLFVIRHSHIRPPPIAARWTGHPRTTYFWTDIEELYLGFPRNDHVGGFLGQTVVKKELKDSGHLWVSLVEVEALEDHAGFNRGEKAFVNALVLADSKEDAESRLRQALFDMCFHTVSCEDTEQWEDRVKSFEVDRALVRLAKLAYESGSPQFGTFHTWGNQG